MTEKEKEGRLYKEISKNIDVNNKNVDVNIILKKIKQKYPKLRKNYINIIEVIYKNNTITQEEIALTLGKSKNSIYRNLKVLKNLEIVDRIGSDKKGTWKLNIYDN